MVTDLGGSLMKAEPGAAMGRRKKLLSKVIGVYQTLLRRCLEHFFPEAILESASDRSFIEIEESKRRGNYRITDDPDGLSLRIEWFRARYRFQPGSPMPFLDSERRLIETIARVLDVRYRAMYDPAEALQYELFHHPLEDIIVSESVSPGDTSRIPAALEALRVASLSTYENRRVSTGALLLGTETDPASPRRRKPDGAPRYSVRLSSIKSFHRLCDGVRTVFVVDQEGDLAWAADVERWSDRAHGPGLPKSLPPCPRPYQHHAKATRTDGHVCLVLSPFQEIKVFSEGTLAFAFSDARWRLLDIPAKFKVWSEAVGPGPTRPADLAARLFQAALNLSENRHGALFVVLRDPETSFPVLVAPSDRIASQVVDDPDDPDNLSPRLAKQALHHLARGQTIEDLDPSILEALAGVDGAVVTDLGGNLLAFGAILRIVSEARVSTRFVEGSRTTAALAASFHGPVLKVSEDGFLTMFLGGRRIWEI